MHIHIRIQSQMWMSIKIVANSSGKWHSQQARRRRENRIRSGKTRSTSRSQAKPQRSEGEEGRAGGKCIHTVSDGKWHSHSHSHSHSLQCAYVIAVIWLESLSRLRYTEKGRRKSGSRQVEWKQEREGRGDGVSGQSVSSVCPVMMGCFAQLRCSIIQAFSHLRSVIPMDIRFDASVEANGRGQLQIRTHTHTKHMQISYLSCSCSGSCSQGWGVIIKGILAFICAMHM